MQIKSVCDIVGKWCNSASGDKNIDNITASNLYLEFTCYFVPENSGSPAKTRQDCVLTC